MTNVVFSPALQAPVTLSNPTGGLAVVGQGPPFNGQASIVTLDGAILTASAAVKMGLATVTRPGLISVSGPQAGVISSLVTPRAPGSGLAAYAGAASSVIVAGNTPQSQPFPRIALTVQVGDQTFPSGVGGTNDTAIAAYGLVILGGNYSGWTVGSSRSRQAVVTALKSQPTTGRTAYPPIVLQYENLNEMWPKGNANVWFPEWTNAVDAANWYVYNAGSSGTKTPSLFNASWFLADMTHAVGVDAGGLFPYQCAAKLTYDRYFGSGGSAGSKMVATNLDGIFFDNTGEQALAGNNGDWRRIGSAESGQSLNVVTATVAGKKDLADWLAANASPPILACANTGCPYEMMPSAQGGLGLSPPTFPNNSGVFSYPMMQYLASSVGSGTFGSSILNNWGGFNLSMMWYRAFPNYAKSGSFQIWTVAINVTDTTLARYAICFILMGDWFLQMGTNSNGGSDNVDYSHPANLPAYDEIWGGSRNLKGFLGYPLANSRGAVQSASWLQGVWRRDFDNGIVIVNPNTNGTQTVALGGTYWHLNGTTSVNNGTAVTTVTVTAGDGMILLNSPP